jgi:hypothetical protein
MVFGDDFVDGNWKQAGLVSRFALDVRHKKMPRIFRYGAFS